jgi:hypothetical protein
VTHTPICNHVKTLAATSCRPNPETPATCEVLAHPRAAFHPYTCGLRGVAATVAAALISYDDVRLLSRRPQGRDNRDRLLPVYWRVTTLDRYFNYYILMCDYVKPLLQLFFLYSMRLVVTIHDLLFTSFIRCHGRNSAGIAYSTDFDVLLVILLVVSF